MRCFIVLFSLFAVCLAQYDPNQISDIQICGPDRDCVGLHQCGHDDFIITDGSSVIQKRIGGKECDIFKNICCRIPGYKPPVTVPPISLSCDFHYDCVPKTLCDHAGKIITDGGGLIDKRIQPIPTTCEDKNYPGVGGICCLRPEYREHPSEIILKNCYNFETCEHESVCGEWNGYNPHAIDKCYFKSSTEIGVCCKANPNPVTPYPVTPYPITPPPFGKTSDRCGHRNRKVKERIATNLSGNDAFFGEFPWQAIIFSSNNYTFQCGAVIISESYLLTAAHCVEYFKPQDLAIRVGDYQVDKFTEPLQYEDYFAAYIDIHPGYNPRNNFNGIALIRLTKPIKFAYHIDSICLPSGPYDADFYPTYDYNLSDQECYSTGWGKDAFHGRYQALQKKAPVPLLTQEYCQKLLRATPEMSKYFILDLKSFICAGGKAEQDACKGDGGGPLSCWNQVTKRYELVGLTSWGIGCGKLGYPGVYVNVWSYVPWIKERIAYDGIQDLGLFDKYQSIKAIH